jgi:hypothetical protein
LEHLLWQKPKAISQRGKMLYFKDIMTLLSHIFQSTEELSDLLVMFYIRGLVGWVWTPGKLVRPGSCPQWACNTRGEGRQDGSHTHMHTHTHICAYTHTEPNLALSLSSQTDNFSEDSLTI